MVFANSGGHQFGNLEILGEYGTLFHVPDNNLGGLNRVEVVVRVHALLLVLGKVFRAHRLADIVVERHHAHQERVRPDAVGDLFGEVRHLDAVVERTGGEFRNPLERRTVEVGHFHEREHRRDAENTFNQVDKEHGCEGRTGDDVDAAGNHSHVERFEAHAVSEQEHNTGGCSEGRNPGEDAPHELHPVTHAHERLGQQKRDA